MQSHICEQHWNTRGNAEPLQEEAIEYLLSQGNLGDLQSDTCDNKDPLPWAAVEHLV